LILPNEQVESADETAFSFPSFHNAKGHLAVLTVRPRIAEMAFKLYGRSLHPELFVVHKSRTISRGEYEARIQITNTGHLVTWRYQGITLTEVCTSAQHPLPEKRRLISRRLKGDRAERMTCRGGVSYQVGFQLEPVEPEIFWMFQQELSLDSQREGMLHRFDASGRLDIGALSYISCQSRDRTLSIQAFHTFPDDYAIVKTQSLYKIG